MTYDPRIHHRRSIRLRGHDYSGGGAYFVTCCVEGKECLLGRVVEATLLINECGQVVQRAWDAIPQRFPSLILDAFQVMPNHLHGILVIPGPGLEPSLAAAAGAPVIHPKPARAESGASPRRTKGAAVAAWASHNREDHPALGDVMGAFKSLATIAVNRLLSRVGRRLLQEDYFEHMIRNRDSLEKIRDYIRTNPARWLEDPENPDRQPANGSAGEWDWLREL
jgi:REP-associated tyrosine transposase